MVQTKSLVALAALTFVPVMGLDLDVTSTDSIKSTASSIAEGLAASYHGTEPGHTVGILDSPYYWWEAGAFFDTLIQYWHFTGDSQYNTLVTQGLLAQTGENNDFMPTNQSATIGNDDQNVWASAVLTAAELNFPEPSDRSWASLAENVFNEQVLRWDNATCTGGLRWQVFPYLVGYSYKNTLSNGGFFQLAARLARYTGNSTYSTWASTAFDWSSSVGFIDSNYKVYDGAHVVNNCTDINKIQFSWAAGLYISGAANMYNITNGDSKWKAALDGLLAETITTFFGNGIAVEVSCEKGGLCSIDILTYKGLLAQSLVDTIKVAPYTAGTLLPLFASTAPAAAKNCDDTECEFVWTNTSTSRARNLGGPDETLGSGVGERISALSFVQGLLVTDVAAPGTEKENGGSSTTGGEGSSTQSGTPTSTSKSTTTGSGTGSKTGTGTPSTQGNSGVAIQAQGVEIGLLVGLLGSMAWQIL